MRGERVRVRVRERQRRTTDRQTNRQIERARGSIRGARTDWAVAAAAVVANLAWSVL